MTNQRLPVLEEDDCAAALSKLSSTERHRGHAAYALCRREGDEDQEEREQADCEAL